MCKKSQATIFMVVAIVILLIGTFFFYLQRAGLTKLELRSPEIAPVKNFVETCIIDVTKQGLNILGMNGGYITFPDSVESNPRSYLQLGPISEIKNPYWWYEGIESIPPESFLIKQLEDYVTSELKTCIQDFTAFGNRFDVRERGDLNVEITLNENDVTVEIDYPIDLINRINSTTIKLENFKETVPVRLKKVYETAKDIIEAENRDFFLEFKTIDLITLDEDIPTTDIEANCNQRVWVAEDVENKLKKLLSVNLPYINVENSDFDDNIYVPNPFGEDSYKESYYENHYKWLISDKQYDNLKISFDYEERWPMEFFARPSKDGLLKSNAQKSQDLLDFLCLHIWHFTYDVVYPIKVTITDSSGIDPYQFSFAFKVSVDHNQPRRDNFASTLFDTVDLGDQEAYCNDVVNEITVFTLSNSTDENDVSDVDLTYTCGVFTCDVGKTDWISFGAAAGLTTDFPFCTNGILRGNKEGFEQGQIFMRTDIPGTHSLHLTPAKEFAKYEIIKHDFDNPSEITSLKDNEKASITIKSTTSNFETFGIFPSEENFPIKLINDEHEYDVTIYLINEDELIGGYIGTWKVNPNLITGNTINFHVMEKQGSDDERVLFIAGLNSYSKNIPQPEII